MPTRTLRLAGVTAFALVASVAHAQPRTVIAVDPASKPAVFGAADLSEAIARWRVPVTVVAPAQLPREAAPNVVVITTEAAALPGQPAVTGLTAQGYAIRRVAANGTTRWWAIGHDPGGAMYAALELAEAARTDGHLGTGRRAPGESVHRQARDQVQHPARRAHAQLLRRLHLRPGEHPRDVGWRLLDALPRRDGAAPVQRAVAVEPQPIPVAGEGAGIPEGGPRRREAQDRPAVRRDQPGPRHVRPVVAARDGQDDVDRREDRLLARRSCAYARDRGIDVSVFTWNIFVYGTEGSGYGLTVDPT